MSRQISGRTSSTNATCSAPPAGGRSARLTPGGNPPMLILVARRARSLRAERIIDMSTGEIIARYAAAAIVGYLVGSIPNGVLIGKLFGNRDPRAHRSAKTATTNTLRTSPVCPPALLARLDIAKGVAALLLARFVFFP